MTEEEMGIAWAKMAAREGHFPAMPPSTQSQKYHPLLPAIRKLVAQNVTHREIAQRLGISGGRVSQILSQAKAA